MNQNYGENTSTSQRLLTWMYITVYLVIRGALKICSYNKSLGSQKTSERCPNWLT